jgi:CDP-4-dehydro-6-deoxyglucose reductase
MQQPSLHTARIQHIQKLTDTVYEFTFSFLDETPIQFQAGQYGTVIIDGATRRQYSFCSDPRETSTVQMVIDTKPMGPGSVYFLSKKVGDAIQMIAPLGVFIMTPSPRKKILIATGTGIAPLKSMILDAPHDVPMVLYWGLRHEEDMYWQEEFSGFAASHPHFSYHLILSKPQEAWTGKTGHVTEYVTQEQDLSQADFYLCGNKEMIRDIKQMLLAHTVSEEQIKTELF